jgi:hypothetical protein
MGTLKPEGNFNLLQIFPQAFRYPKDQSALPPVETTKQPKENREQVQ